MKTLTMDEVAEQMGIGPTGVRDLVRAGHLLTVVGEDGKRVVPADQLDGPVLVKHLVPVLTLLHDAGYSETRRCAGSRRPTTRCPARRCRRCTRTAPRRSSGGRRRSASERQPPSSAESVPEFSSGSFSFLRSSTVVPASTSTRTPSSPTSTMARANSGPFSR